VPLRGNGANGKEISLGASSRHRASNTKTAADIYQVSYRGINAQMAAVNHRDMERRRNAFSEHHSGSRRISII